MRHSQYYPSFLLLIFSLLDLPVPSSYSASGSSSLMISFSFSTYLCTSYYYLFSIHHLTVFVYLFVCSFCILQGLVDVLSGIHTHPSLFPSPHIQPHVDIIALFIYSQKRLPSY